MLLVLCHDGNSLRGRFTVFYSIIPDTIFCLLLICRVYKRVLISSWKREYGLDFMVPLQEI